MTTVEWQRPWEGQSRGQEAELQHTSQLLTLTSNTARPYTGDCRCTLGALSNVQEQRVLCLWNGQCHWLHKINPETLKYVDKYCILRGKKCHFTATIQAYLVWSFTLSCLFELHHCQTHILNKEQFRIHMWRRGHRVGYFTGWHQTPRSCQQQKHTHIFLKRENIWTE